jgi:phosphoglycerol transferase
VVLGDHWLMTRSLAGVRLEGEKRSLFNLFINVSGYDGNVQDRPVDRLFSSLDMAPTILESIGIKLKKPYFALGKSILSGEKTLLEEYGYEHVEYELRKKSKFYNKLWDADI